jgi:hypothetical protein
MRVRKTKEDLGKLALLKKFGRNFMVLARRQAMFCRDQYPDSGFEGL